MKRPNSKASVNSDLGLKLSEMWSFKRESVKDNEIGRARERERERERFKERGGNLYLHCTVCIELHQLSHSISRVIRLPPSNKK